MSLESAQVVLIIVQHVLMKLNVSHVKQAGTFSIIFVRANVLLGFIKKTVLVKVAQLDVQTVMMQKIVEHATMAMYFMKRPVPLNVLMERIMLMDSVKVMAIFLRQGNFSDLIRLCQRVQAMRK